MLTNGRYSNFPLPPIPRTRQDGAITRPVDGSIVVKRDGAVPGTYTEVSTSCNGGYLGERRQTTDVVVPGYKTRSANGEILNNPFQSIHVKNMYGGVGPIVRYSGPWVAGQTRETAYNHANTQYHAQFHLSPSVDALGNLVLPPSFSELLHSGIIVEAHTNALASVDDSTSMALASLGELRKTFDMLRHPLGAARKFLNRYWVNARRRKNEIVLRPGISAGGPGFVESFVTQYLEIYYGLKPFMHDIENTIAAYVHEGINPLRQTARGFAANPVESIVTPFSLGTKGVNAASWYDCRETVTTEAVARSGILYVPTVNDYQKLMGFRWGDVLPAAYELLPWSFMVDYFSNLGKLVSALSPRLGVRYLSAWDVVTITQTKRVEALSSGTGGALYTQPRQGNEWVEQSIRATVRSPVSPYSNVGFVPKFGNFESKTKVLAMIALLTQGLMKKVPILNF